MEHQAAPDSVAPSSLQPALDLGADIQYALQMNCTVPCRLPVDAVAVAVGAAGPHSAPPLPRLIN